MVAVDRPLGVRFALGVDGRVFVHSLRKGVSGERTMGRKSFPGRRGEIGSTFDWRVTDWHSDTRLLQGNAEKSRIIMVGDTLKKAGGDGEGLVTIKDLGDTEYGTSNVVMFHSSKD